jgi:hypothetical protein
MSKAQRDKGKRGEYKTNDAFRHIFPNIERNLDDVRERRGIDHNNTGRLLIQTKHWKKDPPMSTIDTIVKADDREIPVVVSWPTTRGEEPKALLYLDDFLRLLEDIGVVYNE